jgi:hypothetical protein
VSDDGDDRDGMVGLPLGAMPIAFTMTRPELTMSITIYPA